MCCIPEIACVACSDDDHGQGAQAPFDPALYFQVQKRLGLEPYVRGRALGVNAILDKRVECLQRWADKYDPGGKRRSDFAAQCWMGRQANEVLVYLG